MNLEPFITEQLAAWETARSNYAALSSVRVKELDVCGVTYRVQFNPARITSSSAKVDAQSIRQRRCFLCPAHLPAEQRGIPFGKGYQILVNPFPIFPRHLTIPSLSHEPQRIAHRIGDMLELARVLPLYTLFYNGPRCGASAPDHAHFQAGSRGFMPIEEDWQGRIARQVTACRQASLLRLDDAPRLTFVISGTDAHDVARLFHTLYHRLPATADEEPMMNLLAQYDPPGKDTAAQGRWTLFVFPRAKHRPACYSAEGDARLLCSPASVDLGGVFITPIEEDFCKITADDIARILAEVCLSDDDFLNDKW